MELKKLTGTVKQVEWAKKIRENFILNFSKLEKWLKETKNAAYQEAAKIWFERTLAKFTTADWIEYRSSYDTIEGIRQNMFSLFIIENKENWQKKFEIDTEIDQEEELENFLKKLEKKETLQKLAALIQSGEWTPLDEEIDEVRKNLWKEEEENHLAAIKKIIQKNPELDQYKIPECWEKYWGWFDTGFPPEIEEWESILVIIEKWKYDKYVELIEKIKKM